MYLHFNYPSLINYSMQMLKILPHFLFRYSFQVQFKSEVFDLPIHSSALQSPASCANPIQSTPPRNGAGLSHFLDLSLTPPPQVTVQTLQFSQLPQPPSTASKIEEY